MTFLTTDYFHLKNDEINALGSVKTNKSYIIDIVKSKKMTREETEQKQDKHFCKKLTKANGVECCNVV